MGSTKCKKFSQFIGLPFVDFFNAEFVPSIILLVVEKPRNIKYNYN
jgi:hypothetical protein